MARRYSGKRGKAGSKKPVVKTVPSWVRYSAKEIEMLIAKMAKDGMSSSVIGLTLRDKYGVPDVESITKKSISAILEEKKMLPELPDDVVALMKRVAKLRRHQEQNKHDMTSVRGLLLTESKIKRLVKYYKRTGRIPESWKYDATQAGYLLG